MKSITQEAPKKEWEKPTEEDEVTLSAKLTLVDYDPALAES